MGQAVAELVIPLNYSSIPFQSPLQNSTKINYSAISNSYNSTKLLKTSLLIVVPTFAWAAIDVVPAQIAIFHPVHRRVGRCLATVVCCLFRIRFLATSSIYHNIVIKKYNKT
jgi:hypothetical protein